MPTATAEDTKAKTTADQGTVLGFTREDLDDILGPTPIHPGGGEDDGKDDDEERRAEEGDPEEGKAVAAEDEKPKRKKDDDADPISKLTKERDTAEKRRRDTEAEYTRAHQRALELEKKTRELEERLSSYTKAEAVKAIPPETKKTLIDKMKAAIETGESETVEEAYDELLGYVEQRQAALESRVMSMFQDTQAKRLGEMEAKSREAHEDYDDVVEKFLVPKLREDEALRKKWHSMGGTPEDAYTLGKRLMDYEQFMADPENFLSQRAGQDRNATRGREPASLSGVKGGGKPLGKRGTGDDGEDLGKATLNEIALENQRRYRAR